MVSEIVSNKIRVRVKASYLPEHSDPSSSLFVYAYCIRITNEGSCAATLLRRHWQITDGLGRVEEVEGDGVVGEQPRLEPGESYEYASTCPLNTQYGVMRGYYEMVNDEGQRFEAEVSPFKLFIAALSN
jgi:ApaG protein